MTPYDLLVKAEGDFAELVDSLAPADLDRLPPPPESDRLTRLDGYLVIDPTG